MSNPTDHNNDLDVITDFCQKETALLDNTAKAWIEELGPSCGLEAEIIQAIATAAVRMNRCSRVESAAMPAAIREAKRRHVERRQHRVRKLAQDLATDPANTLKKLEQSSYGCDWLLRHWRQVEQNLGHNNKLPMKDCDQILLLCGYDPDNKPSPDADDAHRRLWGLLLMAHYDPCDFAACAINGQKNGSRAFVPPPNLPADGPTARNHLRALAQSEIARLEAQREATYTQIDGPELDAITTIALTDTSKEALKRQKYEREQKMTFRQFTTLLARIRKDQANEREAEIKKAYRKSSVHTQQAAAPVPVIEPSPSPESPTSVPTEQTTSALPLPPELVSLKPVQQSHQPPAHPRTASPITSIPQTTYTASPPDSPQRTTSAPEAHPGSQRASDCEATYNRSSRTSATSIQHPVGRATVPIRSRPSDLWPLNPQIGEPSKST
jgi:hypothetical protein